MKRNYLHIVGVGLACLTAAAHTIVGTYDTLLPLLAADLSLAVKGTFHACWHFISIFLVWSAWSFAKQTSASQSLAVLWIAFGLCFLAVGLLSGGISGVIALPQWVFLCAAGVAILSSLRHRQLRNM